MKYNLLEHANLLAMKEKHPDWIWNRSDTHILLGVPGTVDAFKTPVEPGNSFSPGPGTYGVSTWVSENGRLYAPETMDISELHWSFADGHFPISRSSWKAGSVKVLSELFCDGEAETSNIKDYLTVTLENTCEQETECNFYLVIRSFGASGNKINKLTRDGDILHVNGAPLIYLPQQAGELRTVSYEQTGKDVSCYLREGKLPQDTALDDPSGWGSGVVSFSVWLKPGEKIAYSFVFHLRAGHWMFNWRDTMSQPIDVAAAREAFLKKWEKDLVIGLNLPDRRFVDAFYCQLVHLYMFTVHNSPRISPVSYPLWWLRDGSYVLNALNKGGFHQFSEAACREISRKNACGGFGSEGDGPSNIIWILSEHYLLTHDRKFLQEMLPVMQEKADLLIRIRHATDVVKEYADYCIPSLVLEANIDVMCIPAKDGLIFGRMDGHFPILWVNSFAFMALTRFVRCAKELGIDTQKYETEAEELKKAIKAKSREIFGQNDRDVNCAFWPAGWASRDDAFIMGKFDEFWNTVRYPDGVHNPEPMWTYFEAGQAHNNILAGKRERAWVSIEYFLNKHTAQGIYTYHESNCDENTSL